MLGRRRETAFGTPGICPGGELCGALCGCSAAATACGCGVCGACWRRYDQQPRAGVESVHEVLAFVATQPGVTCFRGCSVLSFSAFFTFMQIFALIVIIADVGGLTSCGDSSDCREGEYCHPLEYRCNDCARLSIFDSGPALPLFSRFDVNHVCRAFPWYVDKFVKEESPELPVKSKESPPSPAPPLPPYPQPTPPPIPLSPPYTPSPPASPPTPIAPMSPDPFPHPPMHPQPPPDLPLAPAKRQGPALLSPGSPEPRLSPQIKPPPFSPAPPITPFLGAVIKSADAARTIYKKVGIAAASSHGRERQNRDSARSPARDDDGNVTSHYRSRKEVAQSIRSLIRTVSIADTRHSAEEGSSYKLAQLRNRRSLLLGPTNFGAPIAAKADDELSDEIKPALDLLPSELAPQRTDTNQAAEFLRGVQMGASLGRLAAQAIGQPLAQSEKEGVAVLTQAMDRIQQSRIAAFPGLATVLQQRPVEFDRLEPFKMVGLGYNVYATTAVQRLCKASLVCIETDLYPLRCDHIVRTIREWRPIGVVYFFLGSFLLAGLLASEVDGAAFVWTLVRFRAVRLRNPCTRWAVLSIGYFRWCLRAYLLPPLAVVAAVSELLDDGELEASNIVSIYLGITFILTIDNLFGSILLRHDDFDLLSPTVAEMIEAGITVQWLEQRIMIIFVVIMGGVLIAAIEFIMMWFRVGDRSEGAALCSDLFDGTMQFSAILVFIIAIVGSAWERQAQRSDGAFRTIFAPLMDQSLVPIRQLICSVNLLGIAADVSLAFLLFFIHRVIVWVWRLIQLGWSQPMFGW